VEFSGGKFRKAELAGFICPGDPGFAGSLLNDVYGSTGHGGLVGSLDYALQSDVGRRVLRLLRGHGQAEQRECNNDPCELVPKHLNFHLLTRYAADFLEAVSNCFLKPVKSLAYVFLGFLDVPVRHPVSGETT
jgi:hypothetical protein